jgi:hypothetical protein
LTQREVFSFSTAPQLLERFEGTPLKMDMRSVLDKIADSLQGRTVFGPRLLALRARIRKTA